MRIATVRRYPVKSMLGEQLAEVAVEFGGLGGDRSLALIDTDTGLVATAKHPRLWRELLKFSAAVEDQVIIFMPGGGRVHADDPGIDSTLSAALGRSVRLTSERPRGAAVERPAPEDVLEHGVAAEVPAATLEIAQGSPGTSFVDHSPVHFITTATLREVETEFVRYRPNLVIETPAGTPAFIENTWIGRDLLVGTPTEGALLRVTLPTPRCAVPTLEHGTLPRAPHAVRALLNVNRVDVPGFGVLPCGGAYAEILRPGTVHTGDAVTLQ